MTQWEIWNFKSWLCFFCHSGKKPNLVSIVSNDLNCILFWYAMPFIYYNIFLILRFVKGFVPACCPVCTRRKKICKHICHNNYGLHLHILLLLRGGKSTCTPNGVAPSCSIPTLTTRGTDDSTPGIDTNAPHESDAQENINIILYDMSITQSFTRTTNESAKLHDHTTTDRHNGRQIAELRWYFHYASPK